MPDPIGRRFSSSGERPFLSGLALSLLRRKRMAYPRRWLLALSALALSCGSDEPSSTEPQTPDAGKAAAPDAAAPAAPDAMPQPTACLMRLGTGVRAYEPVMDGGTVFVYKGPQGGYMIFLAIQAKGFDTEKVNVCWKET